jgi:hypothetical protein
MYRRGGYHNQQFARDGCYAVYAVDPQSLGQA